MGRAIRRVKWPSREEGGGAASAVRRVSTLGKNPGGSAANRAHTQGRRWFSLTGGDSPADHRVGPSRGGRRGCVIGTGRRWMAYVKGRRTSTQNSMAGRNRRVPPAKARRHFPRATGFRPPFSVFMQAFRIRDTPAMERGFSSPARGEKRASSAEDIEVGPSARHLSFVRTIVRSQVRGPCPGRGW